MSTAALTKEMEFPVKKKEGHSRKRQQCRDGTWVLAEG